jgi:predicted DNA-binding antitoxin AbrB/MazE fold protein
MSHEVDAIYNAGVFQPLEPLALAEGTRVHLRVEPHHAEPEHAEPPTQHVARLRSPRLAHPHQIADFQMEVSDASL